MVIEMLLNDDIEKNKNKMILHFQKEINLIMYIKNIKLNFNHIIWTKSQ